MKFLEIEHKYVLPQGFDREEFLKKVGALHPNGESIVKVCDTYYLTEATPQHIYRHRIDKEIQHISVKSRGADPSVRTEVNLDLGHHRGDQQDRVEAFLAPLKITFSGSIKKDVWAYYFDNCEVVFYEASSEKHQVRCIEIEAVGSSSIDEAKKTIHYFEERLGLDGQDRSDRSLFELLLEEMIEKSD